jgi:hypothetical protein
MKQKIVLPHDQLAPMTKLPLQVYKRLQIAIQVFRKFRLKRVEQQDFQELVGKLKDPELITAAGTVLAHGHTKIDKRKARIFLTAFMTVSCPSAILLDIESKQEQVCCVDSAQVTVPRNLLGCLGVFWGGFFLDS